jgi:SAM-dependent methyltransferase
MSSSSASASSSLLPKSHSQFHEKAYWDSFFRDRGQEAFEWYGEFQDLAGNLFRRIKREDRILVIGCGNSNLSACLYDKGFKNITNLDFSDTVIEEMRTKNTERDQMRWIVGDMTNMSGLENESYEVVLDKGALDALVSENSEFHAQQAASMFNEISRVLVPKGRYACITLAESFVLGSFMKYFCPTAEEPRACCWSVSVEVVLCQKQSPFIPFFVVAHKDAGNPESEDRRVIEVFADSLGNRLHAGTKQDVKTVTKLVIMICGRIH